MSNAVKTSNFHLDYDPTLLFDKRESYKTSTQSAEDYAVRDEIPISEPKVIKIVNPRTKKEIVVEHVNTNRVPPLPTRTTDNPNKLVKEIASQFVMQSRKDGLNRKVSVAKAGD
jgi:hypothetical protein